MSVLHWRRGIEMRYLFVCFLLLAGCARPGGIYHMDVSGIGSECTRSCLSDYSGCVGGASGGVGSVSVRWGLEACREAYGVCVSVCE